MPFTSGESATENSDHVGRSSTATKWSEAATSTPVEKQCGTTSTEDARASSAIWRATVKPPQRATSGWSTSTWPRSTSARNAAMPESASPAAMRTAARPQSRL